VWRWRVLIGSLWRTKSVKIEGASGERKPAWLWPTGPDGLWARKGRWDGWQLEPEGGEG
jgi:hypothetical protein